MKRWLQIVRFHFLFISVFPFFALSFFSAFSQNKPVHQLFQKAQNEVDDGHFPTALKLFQQLDSLEPQNAYYNFFLGLCYLNTKSDYSKAIRAFIFTINTIGSKESTLLLQSHMNLGKAYQLSYRFDDAVSSYEKVAAEKTANKVLSDKAIREIEVCKNAKQIIQQPLKVLIENLGNRINSGYSDYAPLITADESILMFTSKREGCTGGKKDENEQYIEDIYSSQKEKSGLWTPPKNLGAPVNTDSYDATVALSIDGEKLFLYRGGSGGLFSSDKDGSSWTEPAKLGININSGNSETSASISPDGKTLFFVSLRKGGYGGKDIYQSELLANGDWGPPVNLGNIINTPYDEESPFIHPDNKTLYFSSQGHNSMGGFDIFKTEIMNSVEVGSLSNAANAQWANPKNIGYPINTPADEIHFILSAKGSTGYYASNRPGGFGEEDIYAITFPQSNIPLTMVRGTIITEGKKKQEVKIKIIDKETNEQVKHVYSPNSETGKYLLIFPPGKNYQMLVDAEGYLPFVFDLYIPNQSYFYSLYQTIYLKPIAPFDEPIGQGVSIENSFYDVLDSLRNKDAQKKNDSLLLSIVDKIIEATDTVQLAGMEEVPVVEKNYASLTTLIETIIDYTDSTALENLDRITQQGFIEKAEKNIFFYGDEKTAALEPFTVGKDTIYIIPASISLNKKDSSIIEPANTLPITEKIDEISIKTVLNRSIPFDFGISVIPVQFRDTLNKIAALLTKFPDLKVEIIGHTDDIGHEKNNLKLSEQRAGSVARFLAANGIEKSKILFLGKGESQPLQPNTTEEGRRANRRVEVRITETIIKQRVIH